MREAGARADERASSRGCESAHLIAANLGCRSDQRMCGHQDREPYAGVDRARWRSVKGRSWIEREARPHGHDLLIHGAVMRPVPPAARRKACILAAVDERRQRSKPEEQDEENGEAAPHLC